MSKLSLEEIREEIEKEIDCADWKLKHFDNCSFWQGYKEACKIIEERLEARAERKTNREKKAYGDWETETEKALRVDDDIGYTALVDNISKIKNHLVENYPDRLQEHYPITVANATIHFMKEQKEKIEELEARLNRKQEDEEETLESLDRIQNRQDKQNDIIKKQNTEIRKLKDKLNFVYDKVLDLNLKLCQRIKPNEEENN